MTVDNSQQNLFDDIGKESVFNNSTLLTNDSIPSDILHREEQLTDLRQRFNPFFNNYEFLPSVILSGPPGTGKTVVGKQIAQRCKKEADDEFEVLFVDCSICEKEYDVAATVKRALTPTEDQKGRPGYGKADLIDQLLKMLDEEREANQVLLFLENIRKEVESLNELFSLIAASSYQTEIGVVITTTAPSPGWEIPNSLQTFPERNSIIDFPEYNASEIEEIIKTPVEKAFKEDAVTDNAVSRAAEFAGDRHGDIRTSLSLLFNAGNTIEFEKDSQVKKKHVEKQAKDLAESEIECSIGHFNRVDELFVGVIAAHIANSEKSDTPKVSIISEEHEEIKSQSPYITDPGEDILDLISKLENQRILTTNDQKDGGLTIELQYSPERYFEVLSKEIVDIITERSEFIQNNKYL